MLAPGGRLLILDTDWDSIVWRSDDDERMARVLSAWDEHLAHRGLPRALPELLSEGGFRLERAVAVPLLNVGYDRDTYSAGMLDLVAAFVAGRRGVDAAQADGLGPRPAGDGRPLLLQPDPLPVPGDRLGGSGRGGPAHRRSRVRRDEHRSPSPGAAGAGAARGGARRRRGRLPAAWSSPTAASSTPTATGCSARSTTPRTRSRRRCCARGAGCRGSRAAARCARGSTRIATNTCLDAIERRPKRVLPVDYGPGRRPPRGPRRAARRVGLGRALPGRDARPRGRLRGARGPLRAARERRAGVRRRAPAPAAQPARGADPARGARLLRPARSRSRSRRRPPRSTAPCSARARRSTSGCPSRASRRRCATLGDERAARDRRRATSTRGSAATSTRSSRC